MLFNANGVVELIAVAIFFVVIKVYVKLSAGRTKSHVCLVGKTAIVTGGNSGMGYQIALALAGRGARVIIADKDNADKSKEIIIHHTNNKNIVTKYVDLSKLETVRAFAKDIITTEERLDILVNHAGVGSIGNMYTKDGMHISMQINHFAPFLLTNLLTGLLKKSAPSRIVWTSSEMSFYNSLTLDNLNYPQEKETVSGRIYTYGNSKLANIITSDEFARRLQGSGVTSNAIHPGLVNTPIFQSTEGFQLVSAFLLGLWLKFISKNAEEGAQTSIHVCVSRKAQNVTGEYWKDCKVGVKPAKAKDLNFCAKIWEISEKLVGLKPEEKHC